MVKQSIQQTMANTEYDIKTIQFPYFDSDGDGIFKRPNIHVTVSQWSKRS